MILIINFRLCVHICKYVLDVSPISVDARSIHRQGKANLKVWKQSILTLIPLSHFDSLKNVSHILEKFSNELFSSSNTFEWRTREKIRGEGV